MEKQTESKDNSENVLFVFGIFFFVVFALDLEYDRDFTTWIWLLTSQVNLMFFTILKIKKIIIQK